MTRLGIEPKSSGYIPGALPLSYSYLTLRLLSWFVSYAMTDAPSHWGEGAALEQGPCHVTGYNANK